MKGTNAAGNCATERLLHTYARELAAWLALPQNRTRFDQDPPSALRDVMPPAALRLSGDLPRIMAEVLERLHEMK